MDQITDLRDLLNSIGYTSLIEDGDYWRTNAVYREGDNKTALRIHKRSGDFQDFVAKVSGKIDDLVKISLGLDDVKLREFYQNKAIHIAELVQKDRKPKIKMEKIWSEKELETLLPHYKFYEERGISQELLRFLRSGLDHSGTMNQRYSFPIYDANGQIHGWSGRDMTDMKDAKWKHIGRKASWIYPAYMFKLVTTPQGVIKEYPTLDAIRERREIILVESIGDMMALWERGYKNVLVTFGLDLSPKLGAFIMSQDIDRVVVALNNDNSKVKNAGKLAAVAMFIELMHYVDYHKIVVALPSVKDFGDCNDEHFEQWEARKANHEKIRHKVYAEVLNELRDRFFKKKITKAEINFGKALKEYNEEFAATQTQSVTNQLT